MGEYVANEGMKLKVTGAAWTPGDLNSASAASLVTIPAAKASVDGKKILVQQIAWTVIPAACSMPSYTHISGGSVVPIMATSTKLKCNGMAALRKGDVGTCVGVFNLTATPFTPMACTCKVEIDDAGQTKVKAG